MFYPSIIVPEIINASLQWNISIKKNIKIILLVQTHEFYFACSLFCLRITNSGLHQDTSVISINLKRLKAGTVEY